MQRIILIFALFISLHAAAQEGIQFRHCTWAEAREQAQKEDKLIFIDFYTQWCGPCLNMAQKIFTLGSVGNFYNSHFVCLKIDAEVGEGKELARKYAVASYPTFVFIDPKTEEAVHVSGSNQDRETFLYTGASALNPKATSVYLKQQKQAGNQSPEFLLEYARFAASRYNREESTQCAEQLTKLPGYGLNNPEVWALFRKSISGRDNELFKTLCADIDKYRQQYGAAEVDGKLFKECNYCPDTAELAALPSFNGKTFLLQKNHADRLIKEEKYEEAARIIDRMMAAPGDFQKELCVWLQFLTRSTTYTEYPRFWQDKCLGYARYMAYNMPDRDEAIPHFDYARQLEHYLLSNPDILQHLPDELKQKPLHGASDYSMRPAELKQKPRRK